ncbi:MAG TPA: mobile mystery protein A [Gallionella sp.]|nr:mobile mystery protein A [Gallionella sp.]
MKTRFKDLKQRQLDAGLVRWRSAGLPVRPPSGWIRAIREALGMPAAFLAKRLGLVPSTVLRLETSEADDTITLGSLRRVAEALDCELQYALVPRQTIAQTLEQRANKVASERMAGVAHSMALEAQATSPDAVDTQVQDMADSLLRGSRRGLWR